MRHNLESSCQPHLKFALDFVIAVPNKHIGSEIEILHRLDCDSVGYFLQQFIGILHTLDIMILFIDWTEVPIGTFTPTCPHALFVTVTS